MNSYMVRLRLFILTKRIDHSGCLILHLYLNLHLGYNHFKEQLAEFLKEHAEKGTVVQREDVNKFFAKVNEEQAAKRRRLE